MDISKYIGKSGMITPQAPQEVREAYYLSKLTTRFTYEFPNDEKLTQKTLIKVLCPTHGVIKNVTLRHMLMNGEDLLCKYCKNEK